jgi:AraC-like DNA-binding protein
MTISEQVRRPQVCCAPRAPLREMLARPYAGFTEAATPRHGFVLPARAAIVVVLTLKGPPWHRAASLAGGHTTFWESAGACPPSYLELWLSPLGAYRLLGMPLDALSGRQVDLTEVLGPEAERLVDRIREARGWRQRFDQVDEFLLARAECGPEPAPEVAWAWWRLAATGGRVPIGRLADEVGWSHKHLITRFKQQVGLPPKAAARLVRLDAVWRRLANRPPDRWDEIAADSGYADQAHLIRDFHQFAGAAPTAFLTRSEEH